MAAQLFDATADPLADLMYAVMRWLPIEQVARMAKMCKRMGAAARRCIAEMRERRRAELAALDEQGAALSFWLAVEWSHRVCSCAPHFMLKPDDAPDGYRLVDRLRWITPNVWNGFTARSAIASTDKTDGPWQAQLCHMGRRGQFTPTQAPPVDFEAWRLGHAPRIGAVMVYTDPCRWEHFCCNRSLVKGPADAKANRITIGGGSLVAALVAAAAQQVSSTEAPPRMWAGMHGWESLTCEIGGIVTIEEAQKRAATLRDQGPATYPACDGTQPCALVLALDTPRDMRDLVRRVKASSPTIARAVCDLPNKIRTTTRKPDPGPTIFAW